MSAITHYDQATQKSVERMELEFLMWCRRKALRATDVVLRTHRLRMIGYMNGSVLRAAIEFTLNSIQCKDQATINGPSNGVLALSAPSKVLSLVPCLCDTDSLSVTEKVA